MNRRGEGTHFVSFETQEHLFSILILGWKVVSSYGSFYSCCYPTCSLSLHIVAPLFITFEEIIRAEGFAIQFSYPVATYTGLPVKKGMGGGGAIATSLFLKSYFARDVFLEIHFRVILQDMQNYFGLGIPRISSGALVQEYLF